MRTNIELDDQLVSEAMRYSGARTKKAVVEAGLRLLVQTHSQASMRKLRGKIKWEGDLNESRRSRVQDFAVSMSPRISGRTGRGNLAARKNSSA